MNVLRSVPVEAGVLVPPGRLRFDVTTSEGIGAVRDDDVMDEIAGQDVERLLLCAHEEGGSAPRDVLTGLLGGGIHSVQQASALIGELSGLGLAYPVTLEGNLSLNGRGRQIAQKIADSFDHGWRRDDLTRRWVLEAARSGGRFAACDLVQQWGTERSRSVEEIERAIGVLAEKRLIKVFKTNQGMIVNGIEQQGRDALERSIVVQRAPAPTIVVNNDHSRTINQHGGMIGGVQLGDGSTQHNTVTLEASLDEVRATLQQALKLVDDLPSHIADEIRKDLKEAIAETQTLKPRFEFIRDLAKKVVLAACGAAASEAGKAIFNLVGPLAN